MKLFSLALVALLATATAASAENYTPNYGSCLASGGGSGSHSWINGCCTREPSCCDHLWDGYGCHGGCGCDIHLPLPIINWGSLHGCGQPYRVPCFHLPKLHCNHGCATDCCTAAPGCKDSCTECGSSHGGCHRPLKAIAAHLHSLFACGCDTACGCDAGCDMGCGGHSLNYGTDDDADAVPTNALPSDVELEAPPVDVPPLPPAPETKPMDRKKNKKNSKDNKTAGMWLFPNLSL